VPGPLPGESPAVDGFLILLLVIELLALTLFVTGIFANHHYFSVPTDNFALVAHAFNAGADLHDFPLYRWPRARVVSRAVPYPVLTCNGRRCGHG